MGVTKQCNIRSLLSGCLSGRLTQEHDKRRKADLKHGQEIISDNNTKWKQGSNTISDFLLVVVSQEHDKGRKADWKHGQVIMSD